MILGKMKNLSGGQKVKCVIGASMWFCPHLVVLDEPTNYLDRDSLGALSAAIGMEEPVRLRLERLAQLSPGHGIELAVQNGHPVVAIEDHYPAGGMAAPLHRLPIGFRLLPPRPVARVLRRQVGRPRRQTLDQPGRLDRLRRSRLDGATHDIHVLDRH